MPPHTRLPRRELVLLLLAAASMQALAWATLLLLFSRGLMGYGLHQLSDAMLYQFYAARILAGEWPYADVPVEYPPLATLVFLLAPSGTTVAAYERWFSTAMVVASIAAAVLTTATAAVFWRSLPRPLAVAGAYVAMTLCCGALAANKYDAVVAVAVAAGLLFMALRAWVPASISLGLGFALKFTPALLLPLVVLLADTRKHRMLAIAGFVIAAATPFVPFLLHDASSVGYPFSYHAQRPLQLESVLAAPFLISTLTGSELRVASAYGSQNVTGTTADTVARLSPWLTAVVIVGVYTLVWRRRSALRRSPELVPLAALALILAAICTSKVLSPQFLVWTFPLVALVVVLPSRLAKASAVSSMLALLLTQVEFPARYWRVVALDPGPVSIVVARNVVLVGAAVLAVLALSRAAPSSGRAREPATSVAPIARS